ncbi:hypothetical protein F5Y10DRAFT_27739 [Nemania abortiva]|nr:hypothetical protein F5Y10DRAFT_27739 [Nemania abortiva]
MSRSAVMILSVLYMLYVVPPKRRALRTLTLNLLSLDPNSYFPKAFIIRAESVDTCHLFNPSSGLLPKTLNRTAVLYVRPHL